MKTKEELAELKKEYDNMNQKLAELSEEELNQVIGGISFLRPELGLRNENEVATKQAEASAKITTGVSINGSFDDPTGYQIAERMRVLNQGKQQR